MVKRKNYIDIQHIRLEDTEIKRNNVSAFHPGDHILIQEKFDGSCACMAYDAGSGEMTAFSRRQELDVKNTLNGFYDFVQRQDTTLWKGDSGIYCFGEWTNKNKITYNLDRKHFLVFDVYDANQGCWMPQEFVREFAERHALEYIHVLYDGPFQSWEHCMSFMNSPHYGDRQEGIVVKNIDALGRDDEWNPAYLKIVNQDFKERIKRKEVDPEKEGRRAYEKSVVESVVTKARIEKMLFALRDDGLLPEKLRPEDMRNVAKLLPKRVYEDCLKEETETVKLVEDFGKLCGQVTMRLAREIIFQKE